MPVESVGIYISGVKTMQQLKGVASPASESYILSLVLKPFARSNHHLPHKALPKTPKILQVVKVPLDETFWSLYLFMFFLISRKSSMAPNSIVDFNPQKQLRQGFKLLQGALVISVVAVVLGFYVPPTAKVIRRRGLGLKSH